MYVSVRQELNRICSNERRCKMSKNHVLIFLFLILTVIPVQAKKLATLTDIMKPDMIAIGNERIYVSEGPSIFVYLLNDFKPVKKFGKPGEGPQEFRISPFGIPMIIFPLDDRLYVSSDAKLSVFTKDGEFIKESRIYPFSIFIPFGKKYIGSGTTNDDNKQMVLAINLYNEQFEKIKELYVSDMAVGPSAGFNFPQASFVYIPYKDKTYIVSGKEGFAIDAFDANGTKLSRIKKNYKEINVPEEYKNKTLDWFKTNPYYKQYWDYFKARITFKNQFPAIRYMLIADDRIYVLTYEKEKENTLCIILDLQGKELERVFLPFPENIGLDFSRRFDIHNRTLYTFLENDENEAWELHATRIGEF